MDVDEDADEVVTAGLLFVDFVEVELLLVVVAPGAVVNVGAFETAFATSPVTDVA